MKKLLYTTCLLLCVCLHAIAQQAALQEGLALKYLVQQPTEKSQHMPVIILLHGYGSNEKDFFELRSYLPKKYLVISVRAPYALPRGGYRWYAMKTVNGKHQGNQEQVAQSLNSLMKFIAQIKDKYKVDAKEVYVAGFSQGAIMSYEVGLSAPEKVKGIGVLSGMIFEALKPLIKDTPALKKLSIFISHGTADDRIQFAEGKAANDYLISMGLKPDFHQYAGMGHTVSNDVMNDLLKWLK